MYVTSIHFRNTTLLKILHLIDYASEPSFIPLVYCMCNA